MLFPSTRNHIEMTGAQIVDVISDGAHDFTAETRSKAMSIWTSSNAVVEEHGAGQISCVYVELALIAAAAIRCPSPISERVKAIAAAAQDSAFSRRLPDS